MRASTGDLELLERRRGIDCRLTPKHALETLDEAEEFLRERGMLTLLPDCSLPSLFGACHEEPYKPGGRGFAGWPKTKWWWGGALAARPGIHVIRVHAGKGLFLTDSTAALADPLCRAELARADQGAHGPGAARLVRHLAEAGPAAVEELKEELGLAAKDLRSVRTSLERVGAVLAKDLRVELEGGGHRHASELYRWDQVFPEPPTQEGGLDQLLVAGVEAAVLAPEPEARRWFSWRISSAQVEALVDAGRLTRPAPGRLSAGGRPSARARAEPAPSPRSA